MLFLFALLLMWNNGLACWESCLHKVVRGIEQMVKFLKGLYGST